jgi:hypothetical protein
MVVEMRWEDRGAVGVLRIPVHVLEAVAGTDFRDIKMVRS